ncbi:MAG: hypothetical protein C5B49_15985 [Bdellovibrio sp.]|nr:MAG: hypothetical protein C5B49_15985 [Bdellovibrio sp.]
MAKIMVLLFFLSSSAVLAAPHQVHCFELNAPALRQITIQSPQTLIDQTLNAAYSLDFWSTDFEKKFPQFVIALFDIFANFEKSPLADSIVRRAYLYSELGERTGLNPRRVNGYIIALINNKVLKVDAESDRSQDVFVLTAHGTDLSGVVAKAREENKPILPHLRSILNEEERRAFPVVRAWEKVFELDDRRIKKTIRFPLAVLMAFTNEQGQLLEEVDLQLVISRIELITRYKRNSVSSYLNKFALHGLLKRIIHYTEWKKESMLVLTALGRKKYGEIEAEISQSNRNESEFSHQ